MVQYGQVLNILAESSRNRSIFLSIFALISIVIGMLSSAPTKVYAYVAGAAFLVLAGLYFRMYFTWRFRISDEERFAEELKKTYTSERITSDVESINVDEINNIVTQEANWLKSYTAYVGFGIWWGAAYAVSLILITTQFKFIDNWLISIFFNSIILFVLGKSVADYKSIRIDNDYLRLSAIHFIGYLPIFLIAGYFWIKTLKENPWIFLSEPVIRLILIAMTVFAYKMLGKKVPV